MLAVALRASTAPSAMCRATWLDPLEWSAMQDPRAAPALAASASLSEARVNRGVHKCRASYHVPFVSCLATCRCHSCTRRAERTGHPDPSLISSRRTHACTFVVVPWPFVPCKRLLTCVRASVAVLPLNQLTWQVGTSIGLFSSDPGRSGAHLFCCA